MNRFEVALPRRHHEQHNVPTPRRHHEQHISTPILTPLDEFDRLERENQELRLQRDEARATLDEIRRLAS